MNYKIADMIKAREYHGIRGLNFLSALTYFIQE